MRPQIFFSYVQTLEVLSKTEVRNQDMIDRAVKVILQEDSRTKNDDSWTILIDGVCKNLEFALKKSFGEVYFQLKDKLDSMRSYKPTQS